jgi:hypothetical protein
VARRAFVRGRDTPDLRGRVHDRITGQDRHDGLIPLFHDRHSRQCQSRLPDLVLPQQHVIKIKAPRKRGAAGRARPACGLRPASAGPPANSNESVVA